MQKNVDTVLTGFTSIYSLFVQSLVATAAIGKLLIDYYKHKNTND